MILFLSSMSNLTKIAPSTKPPLHLPLFLYPLFTIFILLNPFLSFPGPNQLMIAANLIPLVYIVHVIFFVIAYPISLVLDYFLGHDGRITLYNRKEIATMIDIQHEEVNPSPPIFFYLSSYIHIFFFARSFIRLFVYYLFIESFYHYYYYYHFVFYY